MKIVRWLRGVVSVALVLSGLTLYLIHTSPVRRFTLTRIQAYLRENPGLVLQVGEFDYNLFSSKLEFKQVALNGLPSQAPRASLRARHVVVRIPAWRMALGSLDHAQIWIDGLTVDWTRPENHATNWPAIQHAKASSMSRLPKILAINCELNLQDRGSGASIHLPNGRLSVAWSPARNEHGITFGSSSGYVQWKQSRLALDQVQLNSALVSSGFSLSSLQVVSGASRAEISGTVSGSPAQIHAQGAFDVDLRELSTPLGFTEPAQGRIKAELSAAGPVQTVQIKGQLSSDRLTMRKTPITNVNAAALLDTATGQLEISNLSGEIFSGHLTAKGNLRSGEHEPRSELTVRLAGIDPRQIARTAGYVIPYVPRTSVEVSASWPGLEWRRVSLAGSARSGSAKLNFRAASDPKSIRASLQATLGDGATTQGDIAVTLPAHVLSGNFTGKISSIGAVTE
ncbi:MAG TPA: AsmA-like C-terminal region-containing protein, partial [Bryobacteraceae bacterium]|nr:AsmA-like C-terminal region-containing protein [Bryobacteraceae bacterium]